MSEVDTSELSVASSRPTRAAKSKFQEVINITTKKKQPRRSRAKPKKDVDPNGPKLLSQDGLVSSFEEALVAPVVKTSSRRSRAKVKVELREEEDESSENSLESKQGQDSAELDSSFGGLIAPIKLTEISELAQFKKLTNDNYVCVFCSLKLQHYDDYITHLSSHVECHAVCALCPMPSEPFSSNSFVVHIRDHYTKIDGHYECPFCKDIIVSASGNELIQHFYYFCTQLGKCLICLEAIVGESAHEHRINKHSRLLDRFLCTCCLCGFPTLQCFEVHTCDATFRCFCDLSEKLESVQAANAHVSNAENQDDHGILVPEPKGAVLEYIVNPHAVELCNYEEHAKEKFFGISESSKSARKRVKKASIEERPVAAVRSLSPPLVFDPIDTPASSSCVVTKTEASITELEFEDLQPPMPSVSEVSVPSRSPSIKIASPPSIRSTVNHPLLLPRTINGVYTNKVSRQDAASPYPRAQMRLKYPIPIIVPTSQSMTMPNNPNFRFGVMPNRTQIAGVPNAGCMAQSMRLVPKHDMSVHAAIRPEAAVVPRLVTSKTQLIREELRNRYLSHRRTYGNYVDQVAMDVHRCFCGIESYSIQEYFNHLETNHFHDRRINSNYVPRNCVLCVCVHCKTTFESFMHYQQHMKRHDVAKQNLRYCQCCSLLWDPNVINDHLRQNKTNWICGRCNEMFLTEMAFFHHVASKNHCELFYFCKGCNIGCSQPEPLVIHANKCATREGIGFILLDYLDHRPVKMDVYTELLTRLNLYQYHMKVPGVEDCKSSNLYIKSGDMVLRNCCNKLHMFDAATDDCLNSTWKTDRVCPDMFLPFFKMTKLAKDWHRTHKNMAYMFPSLEQGEIKPLRNKVISMPTPPWRPKKTQEQIINSLIQGTNYRPRLLPKPLPKNAPVKPQPEVIELDD